MIDSEWGAGRTLARIEADGELAIETTAARAALTATSAEWLIKHDSMVRNATLEEVTRVLPLALSERQRGVIRAMKVPV